MRKRVLIVGGGTAGWLTAGYLAKRLGADLADGVAISLVESKDIGVLGVGEGTFPTIRRTLATIGVDEAELVRRCGATFKQGARFVHWQRAPGTPGRDHYMHPFQVAETPGGLELLPYWLSGAAGDAEWDEASTPQKAAADAARAPKLPTHPDYVGPLNYAFHFDAVALAGLLRERAVANGVAHLVDTVTHVALDHSGAIERVETERHGALTADLYVDCTGFRAELIGKAMGVPFRSCRDVLFCDRALAAQLPYDAADAPIASQTISTAQEAGWIWDIGLDRRRGIGHVYSSDHSDDEAAERALRRYLGPRGAQAEVRRFRFDAVALAGLLRERAVANGVIHLVDTVTHVALNDTGAIERVETERHGALTADLYVDCTGFRAELIGKAMGVPFRSCRDVLFCDRALAAQLPYDSADAPIASQTISTAQEAGWIWDIGLDRRRGIGHVYSSDHSDDEAAERALRRYLGPRGAQAEVRRFCFDAGFREVNWRRNCVAVGLSSGFFEPLEATGIAFAEVSAAMIANLFPWSGDLETSARQFNANLLRRYERALDFIKLHYCLSERRDTDFWRDNVADSSNTASLLELLDRWRHRWPNELDIDPQVDIFTEASWQYVLYGMGWRTDLSARAGALRYRDDARRAFGEVRRQVGVALANLPPHRALVEAAQRRGFGSAAA